MKTLRLLAGVAALALMSTAAQAGDVYHASMAVYQPGGNGPIVPYNGGNWFVFGNGTFNENQPFSGQPAGFAEAYLQGASAQVMNTNANVSMIEIIGFSADNTEEATTSISNAFTLSGTVTADCSFFVGNVDQDIDFGIIGIETRDNVGPANAFDMTADATASIETNVAGCNTRNRVTVEKGRATGMRADTNVGFDQTQFTNDLDYSVTATWQGSNPNGGAQAPISEELTVAEGERRNSTRQGAWKSVFLLNIVVPAPELSLVAGNYEDTLTVSLDVI
ncbi:hypothetical protein [uncultured Brevundimonas sp.]|uniref:hypothetical protein n=1 Tax=uncultured Brevundimonas sp. TaxID=213418 RepID=UPI0025EE9D0A|nr:hypothetical protein [uncultured Brevundimonas sp.]